MSLLKEDIDDLAQVDNRLVLIGMGWVVLWEVPVFTFMNQGVSSYAEAGYSYVEAAIKDSDGTVKFTCEYAKLTTFSGKFHDNVFAAWRSLEKVCAESPLAVKLPPLNALSAAGSSSL